MQLTFRDIEQAFEINEQALYHWLNALSLPAVKANDQYYFNSVEVLEWALKNQVSLTAGALKLCERSRSGEEVFTPALLRGGVHACIPGEDRVTVLENVLKELPLPPHVDAAFFKELLLSREQTGTTAIGNGIAIPHVKHPVILAGLEPVVGLFFLDSAVDFAAFDGQRVHTLFVIFTGSFKGHLSLLSRLAFCLQNESVKAVLARRASPEEVLAAFKVAEARIVKGP
ncbi:MAG: PTS sugar transporter subunit IIA [Candidatus Omnitrophica bacterium]|nr:PTS sugar transporter subunit IIA [Candidatus Omnitrophota bacterium]